MRRLLLFFVLALVIGVPAAGATGTETPIFETMWGSSGSGDGQFAEPARSPLIGPATSMSPTRTTTGSRSSTPTAPS